MTNNICQESKQPVINFWYDSYDYSFIKYEVFVWLLQLRPDNSK